MKNTNSIFALAKQVRALQKTQIGAYQEVYQNAYKIYYGASEAEFVKNKTLFFAMNDFTSYASLLFSQTTNDQPQYGVVSPGGQWTNWVPNANKSLRDRHNYWVNSNDDAASLVRYHAISTTITAQIEYAGMANNQEPVWLRFDIIRQKKKLLHTTARQLNLPGNMNALSGMALKSSERNKYHKDYFQVVSTKWVKFSNNTDETRDVLRNVKFHMKFDKTYDLDIDEPIIDRDELAPDPNVPQSFLTNMDPTHVYYLVMQSSDSIGSSQRVNCFFQRTIRFRDQHGVAA